MLKRVLLIVIVLPFVIFSVLRITGEIDWPWLWVMAPLWMPCIAILGFILCFVVLLLDEDDEW